MRYGYEDIMSFALFFDNENPSNFKEVIQAKDGKRWSTIMKKK